MPEQADLVRLDLLEVFAAFLNGNAGGFVLVVQRIGGDGFVVESAVLREQCLGRLQFAVLAFAFFFEQ
jgi:hypothetical protein